MTLDDLTERVLLLLKRELPNRLVIGIAGVPGAGKTTMALALVDELRKSLGDERVAHVPMDGYHLADRILQSRGILDRKGAPETFDVFGYIALLKRLKLERSETVYAPLFERDLEQPLANAIEGEPSIQVVFTEGNYLLLDHPGWREVKDLCTEVWFCSEVRGRKDQLIQRHLAFGKSLEEARTWVENVDERNAALVRATEGRAQLVYKRSEYSTD
jgi:pantothenate kinase